MEANLNSDNQFVKRKTVNEQTKIKTASPREPRDQFHIW